MKPDTENVLALEIKREIAQRYFGFRKMIEEDTLELQEKINNQYYLLDTTISYELIRIYILLKDDMLIQEFLELAGWQEKLFYEPYITESPTIRKKVFAKIKFRGLTKAGRFRNLVFDAYERLENHVDQYRKTLEEIKTCRDTIIQEIEMFYRVNDIGSIMGFLRSIEGTGGDVTMGVSPEAGSVESLEEKMRLKKPPPIDPELVNLLPPVPLRFIRRKLKQLIKKAYKIHGGKILAELAK
jgi:hypothetical protein